jgi:hypothetical protein
MVARASRRRASYPRIGTLDAPREHMTRRMTLLAVLVVSLIVAGEARATSPPRDVRLTVSRTQSDPSCSPSAIFLDLTICAEDVASGINLSPYNFTVEQNGITYGHSACTFGLPNSCDVRVTLASPACFTCDLEFDFHDDSTERTMTYGNHNYFTRVAF